MFTVAGIGKFHGWTHSCLNVVLEHMSTIPSGDYVKELPDFGFRTLREQAIHIFNCERFWIQTLQGLPHLDRKPMDCATVDDVISLQQHAAQNTQKYLSTLTDQGLNTNTELYFPDRNVAVRTPALVLHHVLTHAFHHKGQIVAMCRVLGHPARDTDLNNFE